MGTQKVLIIDDSNIDRYMLCEYLKAITSVNYEIIEASSAEIGLEILDEIIPDCILLDNIMEGYEMDGIDSLPFIKKTRNKFTPIIMITAYPSKEIEQRALDQGVAAFIDKANLDQFILHEHIQKAIELNSELRAMTV